MTHQTNLTKNSHWKLKWPPEKKKKGKQNHKGMGILKGGFPLGEMTGDFAVKLQRNYIQFSHEQHWHDYWKQSWYFHYQNEGHYRAENKNERIIKNFNFCSTYLIKI